ncbi:MAG: 4-hydroxy-tetrahydrodipicolinate reductase [Rhodospirillales bacterium]|jgi:4-hydroxy-tetrahydrodipicolinate reductase|nr:4-hydroxy-tetrahydrodipicolinate reductase [Rhodospirillales bacterium]
MKVGIVGCAGRMGQMLLKTVLATEGAELGGGSEHSLSEHLGKDLSIFSGGEPLGITITDDPRAMYEACDVAIDFTVPMATVSHVQIAAECGTALVIGTTGMDKEQLACVDAAARKTTIVRAGNMSVGVNLLLGLVEKASSILGDGYDIEIIEMHHKHKIDAPSGTALMLGEAAAHGRGVDLDTVSARGRDGQTGERRTGDIGFASLRGGDVVGEHSVIFASEGERIEITHKATSRSLFANGAVRAALWTRGQTPGHYSMKDVLGLE